MPKHRRHESFRSFFGSHIDPEKNEELKRAKTEIEGNMQKILQALRDDDNGKRQLVDMIQDFHKHYQLLYESYTHLTEELRMKADEMNGKDSSSSSDLDEMKKLHTKCQTALSKMQDSLNTIREYSSEAEKWNDEISRLRTYNACVKKKLELAESEIARLRTMQKVGEGERSSLTLRNSQPEDKIGLGENKIQGLVTQSIKLSEEIDLKERALQILLEVHEHWKVVKNKLEIAAKVITELCKVQEQKTVLSSKIPQLEDDKKHAENKIHNLETELGQLREKLEEKERELSNQMQLEPLVSQKTESEIQLEEEIETQKHEIASITSEINRRNEEKKTLLQQFKGLERDLNFKCNQILELEERLKRKRQKLSMRGYRGQI